MSGQTSLPSTPIDLPLLPLRDVVVFPHMVIPLFVGRPKSIKALERPWRPSAASCWWPRKPPPRTSPRSSDMFEVGCVSTILQMLKLPDGTVKVLVEGQQRATRQQDRRRRAAFHRQRHAGRRLRAGEQDQRDRGPAPRGDAAVRPVRQAEQEDPARDPHLDLQHRRSGPPGRHDRRPPAAQARQQAGRAGPGRRQGRGSRTCSSRSSARSTSSTSTRRSAAA
jgi:hypothetical protein